MREVVKNSMGIEFFEIEYLPKEDLVYCNWTGFITEEYSAKKASGKIVEFVEEYNCKFLISDNRNLKGTWPPEIEYWFLKYWLPKLTTTEVGYFAHIHNKDVYAHLDLNNRINEQKEGITFQHFKCIAKAKNWLFRNNHNKEISLISEDFCV
ncbi:MAG: hypothetical protein KTR26_08570 [Flammeovirgaceae bacterium]|nr:hypothetical protein [Flammeovirgaceae bacterium]